MAINEMRTGPVRGKGVAAIDYDGARYCIDCAKQVLNGESFSAQRADGEWESYDSANGEEVVERLISEDLYTLSMGGVVGRFNSDVLETEHCMRDANCVHALDGDEHDYDHDLPVGVALDL